MLEDVSDRLHSIILTRFKTEGWLTWRLVGLGIKLLTLRAAPVGGMVTVPVGATVAAGCWIEFDLGDEVDLKLVSFLIRSE